MVIMKISKIFITAMTVILPALCISVAGQIPDVTGMRTVGPSTSTIATYVDIRTSGEKTVFGTYGLAWNSVAFGIGFSASEDSLWWKVYGLPSKDAFSNYARIRCTLFYEGNYFLGGEQNSHCWFSKVSPDGDTIFNKVFGDSAYYSCSSIKVLTDQRVILCGNNRNGWAGKALITVFTTGGEMVWKREYGDNEVQSLFDIERTQDGGLIATGTVTQALSRKIWIVYLDSTGEMRREKTLSIPDVCAGKRIVVKDSGCFLLADNDPYGEMQPSSVRLIRCDSYGDTMWTTPINGPDYMVGTDLKVGEDGTLYALASVAHERSADSTGVFTLCKYGDNGALRWKGSNPGYGHFLSIQDTGRFIIAGGVNGFKYGRVFPYGVGCLYYTRLNYPPVFLTTQTDLTHEVLENTLYCDTVAVRDTDSNEIIRYALMPSYPEGMAVDSITGIITWKPETDADSGEHPVCILAIDKRGQCDSLKFTIHVAAVNDAPVISVVSRHEMEPFSEESCIVAVSATDEENDPISVIWMNHSGDTIGTDTVITISKLQTDSVFDTLLVLVKDPTQEVLQAWILPPENVYLPPMVKMGDSSVIDETTVMALAWPRFIGDNKYRKEWAWFKFSVSQNSGDSQRVFYSEFVHTDTFSLNMFSFIDSLQNGVVAISVFSGDNNSHSTGWSQPKILILRNMQVELRESPARLRQETPDVVIMHGVLRVMLPYDTRDNAVVEVYNLKGQQLLKRLLSAPVQGGFRLPFNDRTNPASATVYLVRVRYRGTCFVKTLFSNVK